MADNTQALSLAAVVQDAGRLAQKRKEAEQFRVDDLREWAQNREFYKGNQYVFWNRVTNKVETLPVEDGDKPRYRVRLKNNRVKKGVHRWIAQMTKNKPFIYAVPDSQDDKDRKSAELAEGLYEHLWRKLNLDGRLQRALLHAAVGQGYWKITFDPLAGEPIRHIIDPQSGAPIDGPLAEMLMEEVATVAKESGQNEDAIRAQVEKYTQEGEINIEPMPGENVIIDPAAADFDSAQWAICVHSLTPDEIKARWGTTVKADAIPTEQAPNVMWMKPTDKKPNNVRRVYIGYFRPGPSLPQGRYVAWIEEPNQILSSTPWPYPFNELPLVKMPGHSSTSGPLDIPPTTDSRPLQKELNRTMSQIVEHKNLTIRPQFMAPTGSLRQRMVSEPGAIHEYNPVLGFKPEPMDMPNLPAYVFEHYQGIKAELDEMFNALPNQRDQLPARIDGPGGIDLIQETAADELLPPIRRLEESLVRAGTMIAQLAQRFYSEPRLMQLKGPNGSIQVRKFLAADLKGGFSFHVQAGSGLPRTRQGKREYVEFLLDRQMIDPSVAMKFLDMPDFAGLQANLEADEDQALREHERLTQGQPISMAAVQAAVQQVQDPNADPDQDGRPDAQYNPNYYQQWAQEQLQQAAVAPLPYEDFDTHIRVHKEYMVTPEFEGLPIDVQQRFLDHYSATYDMKIQIMLAQPGPPPGVNLAFKATTSPDVAAEILNKAGINVTAEQVAELPLETWVTDSADKPNVEPEGNHPLDQAQQAQAMQQQEEQHALKLAKAQSDAALANARAAQAQRSVQQTQQMHDARLKQAKAAKPSGGR